LKLCVFPGFFLALSRHVPYHLPIKPRVQQVFQRLNAPVQSLSMKETS
jgi:hypothetical protein